MPTIDISIKDKIAMQTGGAPFIVRDNSDYVINFTFDAEWAEETAKTARFALQGGGYIDVPFTGSSVAVPVISTGRIVNVGVFAGNLHTTTSAILSLVPSIRSKGGAPVPPEDAVYDKLIAMINAMGEISDDDIKQAVEGYLETNLAQPDWNQNDSTAKDYVKNRTHYKYIEERTFVILAGEDSASTVAELIGFDEGADYTFKIDNIEYTGTIENVTPADLVDSLPFKILLVSSPDGKYAVQAKGDWITIMAQDTEGHSFGLRCYQYKKIPMEYSPVFIQAFPDLEKNIGSIVQRLFISDTLQTPGFVKAEWVKPERMDDSPFYTMEEFLALYADDTPPILWMNNLYERRLQAVLTSIPDVGSTKTFNLKASGLNADEDHREKFYKIMTDFVDYGTATNYVVNFPFGISINNREYYPRTTICSSGNSISALIYTIEGYLFAVTALFNNTGANDIASQDWALKVTRLI